MTNADWNLNGLDGLFFGVASERNGDIFGFSVSPSHHDVVPPPPTILDDNFLSQAFKEAPTFELISSSQFQENTPHRNTPDAAAGVLSSQRIQNHQNISQHFSMSHKNTASVRVGVVTPSTPARNKKPLFRSAVRGQTTPSDSRQTPQFSQRTTQEFSQQRTKATQRYSQHPPPQCPPPYRPSDNLFLSPASLLMQGVTSDGGAPEIHKLRPVTEIPQQYRSIFSFPYFNAVQSKVLDDVFYTNSPIVLCAPTGSGKTVIFELAIIRLLLQQASPPATRCKIVYMAPMKALCSERYEDWTNRFSTVGLKCMELTGDTEMDDYFDLQDVHIILTTPEKWDSMTRRWRDNRSLVQNVKLFLIDEIHLLNDSTRGATMEAVVSRMKTVQVALQWQTKTDTGDSDQPGDIRFVAVSATIPNVQDIAEWLGSAESPAIHHKMDDSCRPVRLRKVVLGYPCSETISGFRFDLTLNYKLARVIQTYSEQKPTLVFCATRKGTVQAAAVLAREAKFVMSSQHKQILLKCRNRVKDSKLRDMVLNGIGYHHAGMDMQDRKLMEDLFTRGNLPVLLATSTLAMGVNLPAHLVVVKSTEHYMMGVYQEYSEAQVLQMIGRAGRPQFDTTATAVIMTKVTTKAKFDSLLNGTELIESSLHEHLIEHLNAEIVLNTISDVSVALEWIKSTFLYIRVMKNPKHYGIAAGLSKQRVEQKLQELCLQNLNSLASIQLVKMDSECLDLKPTDTGELMARYCIAFETMKNFHKITGFETIEELLATLCSSREFSDIQLRTNEKKTLNTMNNDKNRLTIRFPMQGKIKTSEMKVNCLIQAQLGCMPLQDFALQQDMSKIFRAGLRVSRCLVEVLWQRQDFKALLNAVLLAKCFKAKQWESSRHTSRQLTGIGPMLSNALVNAGMTSFQKLEDTNPREIELIINRHPPFGNQVVDAVKRLPKYELSIEQSGSYESDTAEILVTVTLANSDLVQERSTAAANHCCVLLVGDATNKVLYKMRLSDAMLLRTGPWSKRLDIRRAAKGEELSVNFISQDWVGLDVQSSYTPFYSRVKRVSRGYTEAAFDRGDKQNNSIMETGVSKPSSGRGLRENFKACNHRCRNKATCAHECCKVGVTVKTKAEVTGVMETYRQGLKSKLDNILGTPNCKRLKNGAGQPALQQFAYTPFTSRAKMTPPTLVAPPTPSGWDHLDLYEQQQQTSDTWAADKEPVTKDCVNQSLCDEDFVIEDFQDDAIGHWSDRCAIIDSDIDNDPTEDLPTITSRPRTKPTPSNTSYPVGASSKTLPQKGLTSRYEKPNTDNKKKQSFIFSRCQYGNATSSAINPSSVSRPARFSPLNCAVRYVDNVSCASSKTSSNASASGSRVPKMWLGPRTSSNQNSETHLLNNIKPTQSLLRQDVSGTLPGNKFWLSGSVTVEKFSADDLSATDLEMGHRLATVTPRNCNKHERSRDECGSGSITEPDVPQVDDTTGLSQAKSWTKGVMSSTLPPSDNDNGQFLLLGMDSFDDSDWEDDINVTDVEMTSQELPGLEPHRRSSPTLGSGNPSFSPIIPVESTETHPVYARAANFFSCGNSTEELGPDISDNIFAGIF